MLLFKVGKVFREVDVSGSDDPHRSFCHGIIGFKDSLLFSFSEGLDTLPVINILTVR